MKVIESIICWILTAIFLMSAAAKPSFSSVFMILAAIMCLPIKMFDEVRKKYIPNKAVRIIIVVVLFVVGIMFIPTPKTNANTYNNTQQSETTEITEKETEITEATEKETEVDAEITKETEIETKAETKAESTTKAESREDYIAACETVVYSDVERNPQNFEGKNIVISGTVIQVSEGWFNSVTLRIETDSGIWYATYTRDSSESRILENDNITAYGECTGVETYKTLLGANMTIPSMKIKYYDITEKYQLADNAQKFSEGQYKIGADMTAGTYMLIQSDFGWTAYYAITSDANGDNIIDNDNFDNHSYIDVHEGEYLQLNRCYAVALADAPAISPADGYLSDGCYIVGRDIAAGEYKIEATEEISAYVCIYPDVRRTKIVSNDNFSGSRYISVENGQMLEIKRGRILVGE